MLEQLGIRVSMSTKDNCYDNAPMESFWGTLKQELIHHQHYTNRRQAMQEITEYIEIFYNGQRLQAKLGFLSAATYIKRFYAELLTV
jgi:putative transposase